MFRIYALSLVILCQTLFYSLPARAETVWIDVRSAVEHAIDSIEGDIRIPHDDIVAGIQERYPDKSTEIHLYCRGGGRAGMAMSALTAAGYSNVHNAGGIDDARDERGLSVE